MWRPLFYLYHLYNIFSERNYKGPSRFDAKKLLSGEVTDIEQNLLENILYRWYEQNSEHYKSSEEQLIEATKYIADINTE